MVGRSGVITVQRPASQPPPRQTMIYMVYLVFSLLFSSCSAFASPKSVSLPSVNIGSLGSIGLVGDYDAISKYTYQGQQNASMPPKPLDSIIFQTSDNEFVTLNDTDGFVTASCVLDDSVYFSGNFSKIGNTIFQSGLAILNSTSGSYSAPKSDNAFNGTQVNALYCDSSQKVVYYGGSFTYKNSTGAAIWSPSNSTWMEPQFGGFGTASVVNAITSFDGNILFGGSFEKLAKGSVLSSSSSSDSGPVKITLNDYTQQQLSFGPASISSEGTDSSTDATSIVCPGSGPGWKLTPNRAGTWTATWPYSFVPTTLRLYNLQGGDDGTKSFRFTAFPLNGILELSYKDPATGKETTCSDGCPLPQASEKTYMDYNFVNPVSMNSFQLYVLDHYGAAGGLSGLELIQSNLNVYADNNYNQGSQCQKLQFQSAVELSGTSWKSVTAAQSTYESATIENPSDLAAYKVTMKPGVPASGNFSLHLFTPGCVEDGSCSTRGMVNVTVYPSSDTSQAVSTIIHQTNQNTKYDPLYNGSMDTNGGFQPYITLEPLGGQVPLTLVADRLQYIFAGGADNQALGASKSQISLNGLFDYSLANFTKYDTNSSFSPVGNSTALTGQQFTPNAQINQIITLKNNRAIIAGEFRSSSGSHLVLYQNSALTSLAGNGTNAPVIMATQADDATIAIAGPFTSTNDGKTALGGFGIYDLSSSSWVSLGTGLSRGAVRSIAPFNLNGNTRSIAVTGNFTSVNGTEVTDGFAIWVISEKRWLQWSSQSSVALTGHISSGETTSGADVYFGSIQNSGNKAAGAVFLDSNFDAQPAPFTFIANSSASAKSKRATVNFQPTDNSIYAGAFANKTMSILGGHFSGRSNDGTAFSNIALVDQQENTAKGLSQSVFSSDANNTVYSLLVSKDRLFIGGKFDAVVGSSEASGLLFYDLDADRFPVTQPPGLLGKDALVTSLNMRPDTKQLVVLGSFDSAGSLGCPSFCIYDLEASRWNSPSSGLNGLISSGTFIDNDVIMFSGDVTLNGTSHIYFATYNFANSSFEGFRQMSQGLPGPVNSFVLNGNGLNSVFASGTDLSSNRSYVAHWNSSSWTRLDSVFESGSIVTGLQLLLLENNHGPNNILPENQLLVMNGNMVLKGFGNAASVMFDGLRWQPLFLTTASQSPGGTVNAFISQSTQSFNSLTGKKFLKRGFVVLISLAIAIGLTFLFVLLGLLVTYIRRRREGYMPAPRVSEAEMAETVPPSTLIRELDHSSL